MHNYDIIIVLYLLLLVKGVSNLLKIFLCEDNSNQRNSISKLINNLIEKENLDMNLTLSTPYPHDIINYLKDNKTTGLYFLDVDLNSTINGIELAQIIRQYDPAGFIVFITTHEEMSYLTFTYKVEAMDYIVKNNYPFIESRILQCLQLSNERYTFRSDTPKPNFVLKSGDKIINVELSKITFFETSSTIHKIILHTLDSQIEFYAQLKDITKLVDERFYRCHKSFLVNTENIENIDTESRIINMINGEQCHISVKYLKQFKKTGLSH